MRNFLQFVRGWAQFPVCPVGLPFSCFPPASPAGEASLERIFSRFLTSEDSALTGKLKKKVCREFLWRIVQNKKTECEYLTWLPKACWYFSGLLKTVSNVHKALFRQNARLWGAGPQHVGGAGEEPGRGDQEADGGERGGLRPCPRPSTHPHTHWVWHKQPCRRSFCCRKSN